MGMGIKQNWEWEWEGMGNHLSGNENYLHCHGNLFPKVLCCDEFIEILVLSTVYFVLREATPKTYAMPLKVIQSYGSENARLVKTCPIIMRAMQSHMLIPRSQHTINTTILM